MIYKNKPWKHQEDAINFLMPREVGALFLKMGAGKTKIMIDIIMNKAFKSVLIVCPKKVCDVWEAEISKHALEGYISPVNLLNIKNEERYCLIQNNLLKTNCKTSVFVVNYDSVWRDPFRTQILEKMKFDCVICDESHRIKSPSSKCSKFLTLLGKRVKNRYIMTGTPLAQSPLDIYAQYRFLAPEVFGTNYTNFKNQYANWRLMLNGIPILDKANPYKNLDELHKKMYSCAFRCEAQLDLPPTRDIIVNFDMPTATEKHYHHIKKEGVLRLNGGVVDATHALTLIIREQQMTSGYLPVETDTNIKVEKIDTAREEALKDLLEDFDIEENIVIFARFRKDISNIREVCTSTGRKVFEVSGKENTLKSWDKGVLIVQIGAGAEGIDLTKAHYCIYYTLTHSLSQYQQSRARVHRPNQKHAVTYYILQSKMKRGKTIDTHIYEALQNNEDLIQKIMLGNL